MHKYQGNENAIVRVRATTVDALIEKLSRMQDRPYQHVFDDVMNELMSDFETCLCQMIYEHVTRDKSCADKE
jgi:hypothetical protein